MNRKKKHPPKGYGRFYPTEEDWDPNCELNDWKPTPYVADVERETQTRPEPYHVYTDF